MFGIHQVFGFVLIPTSFNKTPPLSLSLSLSLSFFIIDVV